MNFKSKYLIIIILKTKSLQMQADQQRVSRKSRGILYQLKDYLNKQRKTLMEHICEVFQFQKASFKKKQFIELIRRYDEKLVLAELDELFNELDQSGNQVVFYEKLKYVYEQINEEDDPTVLHNTQIAQSILDRSIEQGIDLKTIFSDIRKALLISQEIVQILHLFSMENGGYLTRNNINDVFRNIGYEKQDYCHLFFQNIFGQSQKILIEDFLQKLDLNQSARRLSNSKIYSSKMLPPQQIKSSQFIKDHLRKSKLQQSYALNLSLKKSLSNQEGEYINIENVPMTLKNYFNYGSQLQAAFAHMAIEYIEADLMFIDNQNPPYSRAQQWIHLAETEQTYSLFRIAKSVLVRQKNRKGLAQYLEPKDIIQGNLGDCYFLSAVAGVVEKYPQLVHSLFVLQKNPSHLYGVRLFIEGSWRTVVLDACFPVNKHGRFSAAQPHHSKIWVMLLEKAWAKVYGSYDNIHSGYNQEGLNAVSGAPSIYVSAQQNQFVRRVEVEIKRGSIITCATSSYVNQLSQDDQEKFGIFQKHAYSLLNVYANLKKEGENLVLIKARNPWGKKQWQGRWSFNSQLWTQQLRQQVDYQVNPHDGSFFMSQQDFSLHFDHVDICRVNLAYKNSHIDINSDREQFKAIKVKIRQEGDYFFTLYQQNPRRYAGRPYQKSKSWIFLFEQKDGKIQAIGSGCKDRRDNTLEVSLSKGEYLIVSKIQWKLWEMHPYCLSSYGPQKVGFKLQQSFDINLLSRFIESKARLGFGKKSFYSDQNVMKRMHFSSQQGYGFLLISNQENKIFDVAIKFDSHKGLTILPPYSLPIRLQVFPGEEVICKFLVDPLGYSYQLRQSFKWLTSL